MLVAPRLSKSSKTSYMFDESQHYVMQQFPPHALTSVVGGKIRLENTSAFPVNISKNEHLADIRLLTNQPHKSSNKFGPLYPRPKPTIPACRVDKVIVDPDNILSEVQRNAIKKILEEHTQVFSSKAGRYNGVLGNLSARITLNNNLVEPPSRCPRKVVQSEKMDKIQQDIMDQMEADGILGRPEDYNITVTHMHSSFIVPKMDDGVPTGEWCLVTDMQSLSPYLKPVRLQLPTVEEVFRKIRKWK